MRKRWITKTFRKMMTEERINQITRGYIEHGGIKDKRSTKITKADKKRALEKFEIDVRGYFNNNKEITIGEAVRNRMRSNQYNIYEDIAKENWQKSLKEFDINVQKRSLEFVTVKDGSPVYKINRGKHVGKYTIIQHLPGQTPSYQIVLLSALNI